MTPQYVDDDFFGVNHGKSAPPSSPSRTQWSLVLEDCLDHQTRPEGSAVFRTEPVVKQLLDQGFFVARGMHQSLFPLDPSHGKKTLGAGRRYEEAVDRAST